VHARLGAEPFSPFCFATAAYVTAGSSLERPYIVPLEALQIVFPFVQWQEIRGVRLRSLETSIETDASLVGCLRSAVLNVCRSSTIVHIAIRTESIATCLLDREIQVRYVKWLLFSV
jgi:hypothetical protein